MGTLVAVPRYGQGWHMLFTREREQQLNYPGLGNRNWIHERQLLVIQTHGLFHRP